MSAGSRALPASSTRSTASHTPAALAPAAGNSAAADSAPQSSPLLSVPDRALRGGGGRLSRLVGPLRGGRRLVTGLCSAVAAMPNSRRALSRVPRMLFEEGLVCW